MARPHIELPSQPVRTAYSLAHVEVHGTVATLFLDGTQSSALDLTDPTWLEFEYMQHMRAVITTQFSTDVTLRALHLGGAGCALARALDAHYPQARQLAVELDGELATLVRQWFDLPRSPRLRIRNDDAARALATTQATWNVIIRDTFLAGRISETMSSLECYANAARALSQDGIYLVNTLAGRGFHAREECAHLLATFPHCLAIAANDVISNKRFGNMVLAGSMQPFDTEALVRALHRLSFPVRLLTQKELSSYAGV